MVETMGNCDAPKEDIEHLLRVKQMHFSEQPINWEYLLDKFMLHSNFCYHGPFRERLQYLVMCGLSDRVDSLAFNVWRDYITQMIHAADFTQMIHAADFKQRDKNSDILRSIREKITYFEDKLIKLKEATTALELALWKMRMNEKEHLIPLRNSKLMRQSFEDNVV